MLNETEKMKSNVLIEVERILREPSKDTRRKILISVNLVIGLFLLINAIGQILEKGTTNNPEVDIFYFPVIITFMFLSAGVIGYFLLTGRSESSRVYHFFSYGTVILVTAISASLLHVNQNPQLPILVDVWIGIPVIVTASLVTNRWTGLIVAIILLVNVIIAVTNIGWGFQYDNDWDFPQAIGIRSIFILVLTYSIMSVLIIFQESGMIGKILKVIPIAIEKIRLAAEERKKLEVENARMGAELDVARHLQLMVVPGAEELKEITDYDIAAVMEPASEVGGDYYDVLKQNGSIYLTIGDVTDHGLESGVVMLMAQAAFRTILESKQKVSLSDSLHQMNSILYKNNHLRIKNGRNMSLLLAELAGNQLTLSGQHESVIVCKANGETREIETIDLGIYVGMIPSIDDMVSEKTITLEKGDSVLLYTDGATEAENLQKEQFGTERLIENFKKYQNLSATETVDRLRTDIKQWIGGAIMYDDITFVTIKVAK